MVFARNCWYAASWSTDLGHELVARRFLDEPVVMFRKRDGTPVALADACPHRFAPLSRGILHRDEVECLYHGLRFDGAGRCTDNPNGAGRIPSAARVRPYPLHELWGMIWIWMGDADLADPALIPDYSFMTDTSRYAAIHGYLHIEASYLLMLDNLTDLSHASFIHVKTLEPREMAREIFKVSEEDGTIWTKLTCAKMTTPAFFAAVPGMPATVDHWLEMRCDPPGAMVTIYGVTPEGAPREKGWDTINPNLITPETEWTTHYFWGSARDFLLEDHELSSTLKEIAEHAFITEDKAIIEAQQAIIGKRDMMSMNPVLLPNDNGSGRARRGIDRLIAAERSVAAPKAALV